MGPGDECDIREGVESDTLLLTVKPQDDYINNKPETYSFRFRKVFDQNIKQDEIFDVVAKPVVESVLQGYNGTVFAYGQTGSGKTFTITGGPDRYEDRGIIPRTIQHVFNTIQKSQDVIYTVCISFLEIYNENGYDLLDPKHEVTKLEDLPRVSFLEDSGGHLHVRNLSLHPVSSEKEALNLLFLGDTNRAIAETPMNPCSSRSHCVFTVHLALQGVRSAKLSRAKLHLVDLAGSERVHKTGAGLGGRTLVEARHINLALHFLEQVIAALGETGRAHVPYRNSLLTCVLRDSLGGNCLTAMLATLSLERGNLQETVSTSRFAQRVALVSNDATLNEEHDPQQEVALLRARVRELEEQVAVLSGEQPAGELSEQELGLCREWVEDFLRDGQTDPPPDPRMTRLCCQLLKEAVEAARRDSPEPESESEDEARTKELLRQRDNEIGILISLLRRERGKLAELGAASTVPASPASSCSDELVTAGPSLSAAEREALRIFSAEPQRRAESDRLRAELRSRYNEAKGVAALVEQSQSNIVKLRQQLQLRRCAEVEGRLEAEQSRYRGNLGKLRGLKVETDHLKHGLEQAKLRLLHRFRDWWATRQQQLVTENGKRSDTNITGSSETNLNANQLVTAHSNTRPSQRTQDLQRSVHPFESLKRNDSSYTNITSPSETNMSAIQVVEDNIDNREFGTMKKNAYNNTNLDVRYICETDVNSANQTVVDNNDVTQNYDQKHSSFRDRPIRNVSSQILKETNSRNADDVNNTIIPTDGQCYERFETLERDVFNQTNIKYPSERNMNSADQLNENIHKDRETYDQQQSRFRDQLLCQDSSQRFNETNYRTSVDVNSETFRERELYFPRPVIKSEIIRGNTSCYNDITYHPETNMNGTDQVTVENINNDRQVSSQHYSFRDQLVRHDSSQCFNETNYRPAVVVRNTKVTEREQNFLRSMNQFETMKRNVSAHNDNTSLSERNMDAVDRIVEYISIDGQTHDQRHCTTNHNRGTLLVPKPVSKDANSDCRNYNDQSSISRSCNQRAYNGNSFTHKIGDYSTIESSKKYLSCSNKSSSHILSSSVESSRNELSSAIQSSKSETEECKEALVNENVSSNFLNTIPLTGDQEVDEEIIAFYKVKHKILQRQQIS